MSSSESSRKEISGVSSKIRYAVVGLGYFAQVAVLPAFAHANKNSELAALVSGDPTKLKKLGKKYGVKALYSYEDFEECLLSQRIDAVYIALPNHLHKEYAVRAAKLNVHVITEKPMAVTEAECREMIKAAEDHHVKLMVAYRLHFEAANLHAIELVQSGRLGLPKYFQSGFSMQVKDGNIRVDRSKGGGTLYDIGIYCINAARYLFRDEPEIVSATAVFSKEKRFDEIEEAVAATLKFSEDRLASFTVSFGAADHSMYELIGSEGKIRLDSAYEYSEPIKQTVTIGPKTTRKTYPKRDQVAPEIVYFSDCILNDRTPEPSGIEGLADVKIIQALYESIASGRAISIEAIQRDENPSLRQEMRKPSVNKPQLIHAESPHT